MLMMPSDRGTSLVRKYVEAKTHHEGDNQTSTAYLPGDRTPSKTLKAAYKWIEASHLPFCTLVKGRGGSGSMD